MNIDEPKIQALLSFIREKENCRNPDGSPFDPTTVCPYISFLCGWDAAMEHNKKVTS
jgi:hypothetical protein